MPNLRLIKVLLSKAHGDCTWIDAGISNPDTAVEGFGFHAQQAAEKLLKALLTYREIEPSAM